MYECLLSDRTLHVRMQSSCTVLPRAWQLHFTRECVQIICTSQQRLTAVQSTVHIFDFLYCTSSLSYPIDDFFYIAISCKSSHLRASFPQPADAMYRNYCILDDVLSGYWVISWDFTCHDGMNKFVFKIDISLEMDLCAMFSSVLFIPKRNMGYDQSIGHTRAQNSTFVK